MDLHNLKPGCVVLFLPPAVHSATHKSIKVKKREYTIGRVISVTETVAAVKDISGSIQHVYARHVAGRLL